MHYILFIIGVILIILGSYCLKKANYFIITAISVAVIVISITASILENNEIVIGTLLGSNMFLLLVLIGRIFISGDNGINRNSIFISLSYAIAISVIILYLSGSYFATNSSNENCISTSDGIILLLIAFSYIIMYFVNIVKENKCIYNNNQDIYSDRSNIEIIRNTCLKNKKVKEFLANRIVCFYMISGVLLCIIGEVLITINSYKIAVNIKISQNVLSVIVITIVTFIAIIIGSSISAEKINSNNIWQYEYSVDRLIAFTINITIFALGISSIICNIKITMYNIYDMMFLTIAYILVWLMLKILKKNIRIAGCVMVTMYIAYMVFVCKR